MTSRDDHQDSVDDLDSFERALKGLIREDRIKAPWRPDARLVDLLPPQARDRIELGELLGKGGFGAVYKALDLELGRPCAVKLLEVGSLNGAQLARIKREFRAGRRLEHPNVVQTQELFTGDEIWCFTMELLDGSLRRQIETRGALPLERALHITQEILAALDFIHSQRVVHRDIKPGNVLLGPDGGDGLPTVAKLADFGIARFGELGEEPELRQQVGTPQYMPPEVFDEGRFDPRGDLYAVGLMFLEMITGQHPLGPLSASGWPQRQREMYPKRPEGLPDAVWDVAAGLLQKRPEDRPRSAADAYRALAAHAPPQHVRPALLDSPYLASPSLIGRDREVEKIQSWLKARLEPDEGQPTAPLVLWVVGAAGMGKSRLLRSVLLEQLNAVTLNGRGQPESQRPFGALSAILGHLQPMETPNMPVMVAVDSRASTAPLRADTVSPTEQARLAEHGEVRVELAHRAFIRRNVGALLQACGQRPHLLVLEDAHWCDEASLEMLFSFAQALAAQGQPAALLLTTRPTAPNARVETLREQMRDASLSEEIALSSLDRDSTAALVSSLLMDKRHSDGLAETLHARPGMTPLLIAQTLHMLLAQGALEADADELRLAQLPQTVEQIVGVRVARLSGQTKALLAMGAVLGRRFTIPELAQSLDMDALEMLDYLDEAERSGFIAQKTHASDVYGFVHQELRDVLLTGLGEDAASLHRRAADALLQVHRGALDRVAGRVARHTDACQDWLLSWTWGRRAGELAFDAHGFKGSAEHFERAFAAAMRAGLDPDAWPRKIWGDALLFSGQNTKAGQIYREALARATDKQRLLILGRLAELEYRASRLTNAIEPLEALVPELGGAIPDPSASIDGLAESMAAVFEGGFRKPDGVVPVPLAERDKVEALCHAYRNLSEVAYYFKPERKAYYGAAAGCEALRLGNTSAAAQAFALNGFFYAQEGRLELAEEMADRAVRTAEGCGDPVAQMFADSFSASVKLMSGAASQAVARNASAWKVAQRIAEPLRMMTVAAIESLSLAAAGRPDASAEVAATMRTLGARYGYTRLHEMGFLCGSAASFAALRFDEVRQHATPADRLEASGSLMIALQMRSYASVADACLNPTPDPEGALSIAERWHSLGFESLMCNIDAHALLAGALAGSSHLTKAHIERFDARIKHGWETAHRNRIKTGLFLASAGLYAQAVGNAAGSGWLAEGLDLLRDLDLRSDLALVRHIQSRLEG